MASPTGTASNPTGRRTPGRRHGIRSMTDRQATAYLTTRETIRRILDTSARAFLTSGAGAPSGRGDTGHGERMTS